MMRSMFAAISGLKNHQTFMDVVGNNIANVNTTGFKQSRVTFQDILSQTLRGASGPQGGRGGVNARMIGCSTCSPGLLATRGESTFALIFAPADTWAAGFGPLPTSMGACAGGGGCAVLSHRCPFSAWCRRFEVPAPVAANS